MKVHRMIKGCFSLTMLYCLLMNLLGKVNNNVTDHLIMMVPTDFIVYKDDLFKNKLLMLLSVGCPCFTAAGILLSVFLFK